VTEVIDWSTQLKKIERQFNGIPTPPTESQLRIERENERREQLRRLKRGEIFTAASRVVLAASLGLAMNAWPYDRACGGGLVAYLAASVVIVAGGVWAVVGTWNSRAPRLHAGAMLVIAWGVVLITAQVLPRAGYTKGDAGNRLAWRCWGPNQKSVGVPVVNGLLRRWLR
jgi:hypothetical protein